MSLKPKSNKAKRKTAPLAGVPKKDNSLQKGKLRGNLLVWEGYAKSKPEHGLRESYVLAYYPVKSKFTARDGHADYDSAGWSGIGGKLTIKLEEYGFDTYTDPKGDNRITGKAKYIGLRVSISGTGRQSGGVINLKNTPENVKYLRDVYNKYILSARKAKSIKDIYVMTDKAYKLQAKHRGF